MLTGSRSLKVFVCVMVITAMSSLASAGAEDLDRGHRLLLEYGLQIQGGVNIDPTILDEARWLESNFTTHHFISSSWTYEMPGPPTRPWSRWNSPDPYAVDFDPAYWVMASAHDEAILTPGQIETYATWLEGMRDRFPQVISHTTQWPTDNTYQQIVDYTASGKPDLLFFDFYQFGEENAWPGGSPTELYTQMGLYRTVGLAGHDGTGTTPIPVGQWFQAYRSGTDGFPESGHVLSESELTLEYFSSWAYGYKVLAAFLYATGPGSESVASVFFSGPSDTNPTPLFYTAKELNRQSLNMGTSLLRLVSTDVSFVRGLHGSAVTNDLPGYTQDWSSGAGTDSYLDSVVATYSGTLNDGQRGDVIVGHMKVLDEDFDGSATDEIYFMIVNGLTDSNGLSEDMVQQIRLDFDFGASGITQLQRLDRNTGKVVDVPLVHITGSEYYLILDLDGGEGDLFKYDTGARFVGLFDGDVNDDGFVGAADMGRIITNWGESGVGRSGGDLDDNGVVGAADYQQVLDNWNSGIFPSEPPEAPGATPEPSTLLLLLGGLALLRKRRK